MDEVKRQKVIKFMNDKVMVSVIKEIIRDNFLKSRGTKDVHVLAAQTLAIGYLDESFKELNRLTLEVKREPKKLQQIGL